MTRVNHHRRLVVLAGLISGIVFLMSASAQAKLIRSAQAEAKVAAAKVAEGSPSDQVKSADGCTRCCDRCITYRHHCTVKKTCCGCDDPVKTILEVKDPCCCCVVEIPVCLPACCDGSPKVCCREGVLGREVVTYEWCCGFKVRVVFDRCGDVTVHTYGR